MSHLFRDLAPITDEVWATLDDEARARLAPALGARKLVDFSGPHGWSRSSIDVGRVGAVVDAPADGVIARSRVVLPLAEVRADFALRRSELDAGARGAADLDLGPLDAAARRLAVVENAAAFAGWDAAGFPGIVPSSPHEPLTRADDPTRFAQQVAAAVATLAGAGVGGPYGLALDTPTWINVQGGSDAGGSPLRTHLLAILGGPIEWVPGIDGAVVLSLRGGDYVLESGQDISLGFAAASGDRVDLYLEESFAFRVLTPEAAVAIR